VNGTDPQRSTDPADFAFPRTLYRPVEERDACGTGFVASIAGERRHGILRMGVEAVINLTHRGAATGSARAAELLARWEEVLPRFWKVAPKPPEGLREPPPRVEEVAAEPATVGAR